MYSIFQVSGYPISIEAQKSQIKLVDDEFKVENLHQLLNVRTIRLLHFISIWSRQLDKLIRHPKLSSEDKKYKRKMAKKANEDMVSLILTRERRRSSSLPESRSAVSGVELLTDQLVSSIMGEITGKSSQENLEFPGRPFPQNNLLRDIVNCSSVSRSVV